MADQSAPPREGGGCSFFNPGEGLGCNRRARGLDGHCGEYFGGALRKLTCAPTSLSTEGPVNAERTGTANPVPMLWVESDSVG